MINEFFASTHEIKICFAPAPNDPVYSDVLAAILQLVVAAPPLSSTVAAAR